MREQRQGEMGKRGGGEARGERRRVKGAKDGRKERRHEKKIMFTAKRGLDLKMGGEEWARTRRKIKWK